MTCNQCNCNPCLWFRYEEGIRSEVSRWLHEMKNDSDSSTEDTSNHPPNNEIRKKYYRVFIFLHHGFLGGNERARIPECVTAQTRILYPDSNEKYMGFKEE